MATLKTTASENESQSHFAVPKQEKPGLAPAGPNHSKTDSARTKAVAEPRASTKTSTTDSKTSTSIASTTKTTAVENITLPIPKSVIAAPSPPPKRICYTKQQMLALSQERVSLQRPASLPDATLRPRYRDSSAKDKVVERDHQDNAGTTKPHERPPPKEQQKPAESKARKGDRYGTPSWFTEDIDAGDTFTFGTLDREADRAQMGLGESKATEQRRSISQLTKPESRPSEKALESDDDDSSEGERGQATLPPTEDVHLSLPRAQTPEQTELGLPTLEHISIREPSNKEASKPAITEQGPWNTWPSLFGPLFPGFASDPPRHDPWSEKHDKSVESRKVPVPASSASDQTAALKSMLKIGGSNLGNLTKPAFASMKPAQPEWTNDAHFQGDSGWGVQREQEFAPKSNATSSWPEDVWQQGHARSSGWQETDPQDAEWREGISGWQASEADVSWPDNGRPVRAEWHSRDPRAVLQRESSDEIMFQPSTSNPDLPAAYNSFNASVPVDAQWSIPTVSVSASSNAATVAKRSATVNVQTLFNLNLPNRNPPPRAVMASTLENRQLVRTAALSHMERERTLDAKSGPLSRPTVSFTPISPTLEARTIRLDQSNSQEALSEHMARMVTKAHLQRKIAPTSPPSVTFSNRSPPMRYSQNQFARPTSQPTGYADTPQQSQSSQLSSQQQQALFFQQNSQFILQHSQPPTTAPPQYPAYPPQQYPQQAVRTSFSNIPSNSGSTGPLDKWFGHMLPKPNPLVNL